MRSRKSTITVQTQYIQLTPIFYCPVGPIMLHVKTVRVKHIATVLNYGFEYLGKFAGHMAPAKREFTDSESTAYLRGTWLKTKKYQTVILAYYRTLHSIL